MCADLMTVPRKSPSSVLRSARSLSKILAITIAMGMTLPSPVSAQSSEPAASDLRALIYYLDHDDQRSVQAEMRRLRSQFPMWTPPSDVNQLRAMTAVEVATVDVAPIWNRIQRNDFAGARSLIDQARTRVPGWSPDAEMLRLLETGESQAAFEEAYARRDLTAAVAAARRTPALIRCDRINNAWRLAELYELAEQNQNAVTTYRGVLTSCTQLTDVVPTLEKADRVSSLEEITALFDLARQRGPASSDRLTQLEERLRAGRGAGTRTASTRTTTRTTTRTAAATTTAVVAAPVAAAPASAAAPLPATPVAAGRLGLRGDGRISTVRRHKEQGNWPACLAASANPRSIEILYERSWCAYNLDRSGEALAGFTIAATRGSGLGGNIPRDSRFGMILAYLAMHMTEEGARVAASTNLTRQQRVEVETTILDQRGVRAYHSEDYGQSVAYFNALQELSGSLRRDLAMLRAYAYLNLRQYDQALAEFTRLHNELATDDTRSALQSLSNIMSSG